VPIRRLTRVSRPKAGITDIGSRATPSGGAGDLFV
jgi:hypothetical protein